MRSVIKRAVPHWLVARRLSVQSLQSVLLTFDDGPHPDVTPAVLDRLDAFGAKAVFFLVGRRIKRAATLPEEIQRRGHILGNHTHLHRAADVISSGRRPRFCVYRRDCKRCQDAIERHAGRRPRVFRPPGGRLTPVTMLVPKLLGLRLITWSIDVGDWKFRSASEAEAGGREALRLITPGDIVLLHDDNIHVLALLDVLLPGLLDRGYDLACGINDL